MKSLLLGNVYNDNDDDDDDLNCFSCIYAFFMKDNDDDDDDDDDDDLGQQNPSFSRSTPFCFKVQTSEFYSSDLSL